MNKKALKFHYEEIVFILMILATDLRGYIDGDLKNFAEAIHRIDTLSEPDFLKKLSSLNPNIDDNLSSKILELQNTISKLYSGNWYKTLTSEHEIIKRSRDLSKELLGELSEIYVEPIRYSEENMDVDW